MSNDRIARFMQYQLTDLLRKVCIKKEKRKQKGEQKREKSEKKEKEGKRTRKSKDENRSKTLNNFIFY